jgi:hypothetical protein
MPSGSPLAGMARAAGKGAIARKGMFTRMIFEGRLTRDEVRRKNSLLLRTSSIRHSYFVTPQRWEGFLECSGGLQGNPNLRHLSGITLQASPLPIKS